MAVAATRGKRALIDLARASWRWRGKKSASTARQPLGGFGQVLLGNSAASSRHDAPRLPAASRWVRGLRLFHPESFSVDFTIWKLRMAASD